MTCQWREDADGMWKPGCSLIVKRCRLLPAKIDGERFCSFCNQPLTEIAYDDDAEESE
jgi:hypothetical protein